MNEEMDVGLLNVTVKEFQRYFKAGGQVDGDGGFTGSALAARDADDHKLSHNSFW
jgi:hypothetical protein